MIQAFGYNPHGQCNIPDLAGRKCLAAAAGASHSLLLLDDGSARAFGNNYDGQCNIPDLAGRRCLAAAAGWDHSLIEGSGYLTRIWCVFEVFIAQQHSVHLDVIFPGDATDELDRIVRGGLERIRTATRIDVAGARSSEEPDERGIKKLIQAESSFEDVNEKAASALVSSLMAMIFQEPASMDPPVPLSPGKKTAEHREEAPAHAARQRAGAAGVEEPAKHAEEPAPPPRSEDFDIKLQQNSIGLDISRCTTPVVCLKVEKVKPGLVVDWNSSNPDKAVKEDDRIVSVNGASGDADAMLERIAKDTSLDMKIKRV